MACLAPSLSRLLNLSTRLHHHPSSRIRVGLSSITVSSTRALREKNSLIHSFLYFFSSIFCFFIVFFFLSFCYSLRFYTTKKLESPTGRRHSSRVRTCVTRIIIISFFFYYLYLYLYFVFIFVFIFCICIYIYIYIFIYIYVYRARVYARASTAHGSSSFFVCFPFLFVNQLEKKRRKKKFRHSVIQ